MTLRRGLFSSGMLRQPLQANGRGERGFTMMEMLVTTAMVGVISVMLTVPLSKAIVAYQDITDTSHAEIGLSTTAAALRSELSLAREVHATEAKDKVYYLTNDGYWASIGNSDTYYGLEVVVYKGVFDEDATDFGLEQDSEIKPYPLISNATITQYLRISFDSVEVEVDGSTDKPKDVLFTGLKVVRNRGRGRKPAAIDELRVVTRFTE